MKNILFITWEGPQTNYMEGLFLPIFNEIQKTSDYQFHIIQFTWGSTKNEVKLKQKAENFNIFFTKHNVLRTPNVLIGSLITINKGIKFIEKYIAINTIDIVIPRSTMPSIMVNRIKNRKFKLIFDADGLPLEERVDFSGLSPDSFQYKFLRKEETKMLNNADFVLTRSKKAIKIHLSTIDETNHEKFSVVTNGRDVNFFKPNTDYRNSVRKELNASDETKVFVYSGSLGPQYGWNEMMMIFEEFLKRNTNSKFLILSGNLEYALARIPIHLKEHLILKNVAFEEVPKYLSAADVAFAMREPKYSMTGVAPIKIGEYLLMGIPIIASKGIGDSEKILKENPNCFLFKHQSEHSLEKALIFIQNVDDTSREEIRAFGVDFFSLEKSALTYVESLNLIQ
ncbi:glycosyltransferase [Flavobacterium sp. SUN052]|uniref:glycosyltransferase n=1 Tax=Flavobacterium sp. SUN052 TaxID=3002441 RepID=UPI00237D9436|nr:glycosyltransferase [Flavobacterium sp. SUN052]MEC4005493.1 glycosyltransferase [Flavobacterium sp. SUN052]